MLGRHFWTGALILVALLLAGGALFRPESHIGLYDGLILYLFGWFFGMLSERAGGNGEGG